MEAIRVPKTDPLVESVSSYKKMLGIDAYALDDAIELAQAKGLGYLITAKIDGELTLIHYSRKENACKLVSRFGTVRTSLPVTDELKSLFDQNRINEFVGVGELFVRDDGKVVPYPKAMSTLRAPKSPEDELKIHIMVFDILEIDGVKYEDKPLMGRVQAIQKYIHGDLVEPVTIFDTTDIRQAWQQVTDPEKSLEGLVIVFADDTRIKVKPIITLDTIVVGVERSEKDFGMMGALQMAFMTPEGLFVFDSKVGTGFSEEDRRVWLEWAEENKVAEHDNVILVDPFADPRIIEVFARELSVTEGPGMRYDKENRQWSKVDDFPVGSLRQPSFSRIREDKEPVPEDLRIEQVVSPNIKKSEFGADSFAVIQGTHTLVVSKDWPRLKKLADLYDSPAVSIEHTPYSFVSLDVGNDFGFPVGSQVISLAKGITGRVIGYEQAFCPDCSQEALYIPSGKFPMFTMTYICPDCGYVMERTDIDIRVLWDEPIDGAALFSSEAHPSEIERVDSCWLQQAAAITPGTEENIVIQPNEFYPHGLTKQDVVNYYNTVKPQILEAGQENVVFPIIVTDKGPVLKRYMTDGDKKKIVLDASTFDQMNTGRTLEMHRVIDSDKTDRAWVDIDPREQTDFGYTKKVTKTLVDYLDDLPMIRGIDVFFSGNRGFHLILSLDTDWNVDEIRGVLLSTLESFIADAKFDNLTTGVTHDPRGIRFDVSTLKQTGSLKMPYSLSYKTGLAVIPVNISDILKFEKSHARIPGMTKSAYKDTEFKKLIGYRGRFVIQEHRTAKDDRKHFDLRFEIPTEIAGE